MFWDLWANNKATMYSLLYFLFMILEVHFPDDTTVTDYFYITVLLLLPK